MRQFNSVGSVPLFAGGKPPRVMSLLVSVLLTSGLIALFTLKSLPAEAQTFAPYITATAGSGSNESFVDVNFDDGPGGTDNSDSDFMFGYFWNSPTDGQAAPTGWDAITALESVGLQNTNGYDPTYGYYIDSFSFDGHTQAGFTDSAYWAEYNSSATRLAANTSDWTYASLGPSDTDLSNGSVDGWIFNGTNVPVVPTAPAPELSSSASLLAGCVVLGAFTVHRRRRRNGDSPSE